MPAVVTQGYHYFDSICKLGQDINQVDSLFQSSTYSDTTRRFLKHLYTINDYDPVAYWRFLLSLSDDYLTGPWYVQHRFLISMGEVFPYKIASLLAYSDIIAHVKVVKTFETTNDSASYAKRSIGVICEVLDTIKGHNWPLEKYNRYTDESGKKNTEFVRDPRLEFEYCPTWNRKWDLDLLRSDGSDWVRKDQEYIVFLRFQHLTSTDSSTVLTLWPSMIMSTSGTMYAIESGVIEDPDNDFGFGIGLSAEDWKSALRLEINRLITVP